MVQPATGSEGKAKMQGLALWLLLLSIFTHALVPTGSPLHRQAGSAFSASTAEVSLAPSRKQLPAKQAQSRGEDEGSSEGAGSADPIDAGAALPPAVQPANGPAVLINAQAAAAPAAGSAASFDARAPPSR